MTDNPTPGHEVVVNATLPGHDLGNGIVVREVTGGPNGTSVIHNFGEGNGEAATIGLSVCGSHKQCMGVARNGAAPTP